MMNYDLVVASHDTPGLEKLLTRNGAKFGPLDAGFCLLDKRTNKAAGAFIFNDRDADNIEMSVYFDCIIPVNRNIISTVFAYPFLQLGVNRLTVRTRAENIEVRRKIRRLGFKPEGRLRKYFGDDDAMVYGMLRDECKWIG